MHRTLAPLRIAAAAMLLAAVLLPGSLRAAAWAADATPIDITAQILSGANVTLTGDSVVNLPAGTTTYNGVLSGQGTLTVRAPSGSGTLVLTKDSDFTLPTARVHQVVTTSPGNHPVTTVSDPDPPAVIVAAGATLQYGNGGSTGVIGHYPYSTACYQLNDDNIEVDGTLLLPIINRNYNLGTISGSGLVSQPRFNWGTLELGGTVPFSGVIANGTGMNFDTPCYPLSLPNARAVLNAGSAILSTPQNYTLALHQDFYERNYGNDINFHTTPGGLIVMTGVYSYADGGPDTAPTLSSPALNTATIAHGLNTRGINIEGAHVQWGDGSTDRFFLPATSANSYINVHSSGTLAFDYDGPVTLGTPISGGIYHASLSTPAVTAITLLPTAGNAVTFATPQNYHGPTTIGADATLLLGTGQAGSDSALLTGTAADSIVDNGSLVARNAKTPLALSQITGSGSFTQAGPARTTLTGSTTYTGTTTVSGGTLALGSGAAGVSASSALTLTSSNAAFDVSAAGDQTVRDLSGVAGSALLLGSHTLAVETDQATTFAGTITGTGSALAKTGAGALTLSGRSSTPGGTWQLNQGTLSLVGAQVSAAGFTQAPGTTLALTLTPTATATATGDSAASAPLQLTGAARLSGAVTVSIPAGQVAGTKLTLIHSSSDQPVSGTFAGLPEGATFTSGGTTLQISYRGGSGHDVVVTVGATATAAGTAANSQLHAAGASSSTAAASAFSLRTLALAAAAVLVLALVTALLLRRRLTSARSADNSTRHKHRSDKR